MKNFTDTEAAYIAGFLEGEGSFSIDDPKSRWRARVTVGQKDPTVLEYIRETTGIGYVRRTVPHVKSKWGTERTPTYVWALNNRKDVLPFVHKILPFLISKRTRKRAGCVYNMSILRSKYGRRSPQKIEKAVQTYEIFKTTMTRNGGK